MPRSRVALLLLLLAAAALAGAWWRLGGADRAATGSLTLSGNVDLRQVELAFQVGGRVAAMRLEEGAATEAGQVVAALETDPFRDELREAQARADAVRSALERLRAGSRPEEVAQARAAVAARQAEVELARVTLGRQEQLADRGFATHQRHDEIRAALAAASTSSRRGPSGASPRPSCAPPRPA